MATTIAAFGQGSGPVLLSTLQCFGNESYLLDCPGAVLQSSPPCQHSRDVGVTCNERPCMYLLIIFANGINFECNTYHVAYPSNVMASAASNTSISVTWGAPAEFQSSIVNYRLK